MHIGAKLQNFSYQLVGSKLSMMDQKRALGVLVDSLMKVSTRVCSDSEEGQFHARYH